MEFKARRLLWLTLAVLMCGEALGAEQRCFLPTRGDGGRTMFIEPDSKVCRAFERELNATCSGDIPRQKLELTVADSGVSEPAWSSIELYQPDGRENPDGFALLEKLARSRALTTYSVERDTRAARDVETVLREVRASQVKGGKPRLDKTALDLEGRGREEVLYRLYIGLARNPPSITEISFKQEPQLYLERAIELAPWVDAGKVSPLAAGSDVVVGLSEVFVYAGIPYLLKWSGETVLINAAYLQRNRPISSQEAAEQRGFILPTPRCLFESRPNH
jgi:hypothetical protein